MKLTGGQCLIRTNASTFNEVKLSRSRWLRRKGALRRFDARKSESAKLSGRACCGKIPSGASLNNHGRIRGNGPKKNGTRHTRNLINSESEIEGGKLDRIAHPVTLLPDEQLSSRSRYVPIRQITTYISYRDAFAWQRCFPPLSNSNSVPRRTGLPKRMRVTRTRDSELPISRERKSGRKLMDSQSSRRVTNAFFE